MWLLLWTEMFWRTRVFSLSAPSSEREEKFRKCLILKMEELQSIETWGTAHLQQGVMAQNALNLLHNFKDIPPWATQNFYHVVLSIVYALFNILLLPKLVCDPASVVLFITLQFSSQWSLLFFLLTFCRCF